MAKKIAKEKAIEEALWESANKLRGSVEPSEYKHVVLSLIFLKYAHDRFTERRNELMAEGKEAFADNPVFYNAKNVFYLEPESRSLTCAKGESRSRRNTSSSLRNRYSR